MAKIVFILIFVATYGSMVAQKGSLLKSDQEAKEYLIDCLKILEAEDPVKYKSIRVLNLKINRKGCPQSFELIFANKSLELSSNEYKQLLKKIKKRNFKKILYDSTPVEEMKNRKEFTLSFRLNPNQPKN